MVLYARCVLPWLTNRPILMSTVKPTLLCSMFITHTSMKIFGRSVIVVVIVGRPTFTSVRTIRRMIHASWPMWNRCWALRHNTMELVDV